MKLSHHVRGLTINGIPVPIDRVTITLDPRTGEATVEAQVPQQLFMADSTMAHIRLRQKSPSGQWMTSGPQPLNSPPPPSFTFNSQIGGSYPTLKDLTVADASVAPPPPPDSAPRAYRRCAAGCPYPTAACVCGANTGK